MVTLARTPGSTVPVSVTVASSNGSATAGSDYTALNTSVTFADGDSAPKPVTVPILEDSDGELDETLNVTLSAPTGGATLGTNERAAITILDNDPANAPVPTLGKGVKQLVFNWASVPGATRYRLFENPDGASGFTQIGPDHDAAVTQARRDITAVYRFDWVNALYQLEACNARGCRSTTVGVVDAMVQAIGYFKASNTDPADSFGCSVALSADGNTLAVGACNEASTAQGVGGNQADNFASRAGAVYVFTRTAGQWSQQAYVKASNTQRGDEFGTAVALSENGNTLAVGAPLEDSAAVGVSGNPADQSDNSATDAGAVYVFTRSGVQWSQQAYVKASNTDAGDKFGTSIALNGDGSQLAVGAPGEASGVFNDETDNSRPGAGAVYMYTRADTQWSHSRYLKPLTIDSGDQFGFSIALSADGNTLAVGEPGEDSDSGTNQGNNASSNAGAVQVFDFTNPVPVPDYVKASNIGQADEFGFSVALSADGSTLAVGAHSEDSGAVGTGGNQNDNSAIDAGAAYVFIPVAGPFGIDWQQQAYVKASNTRASKRFGHSLALSADGNTLAVGSLFEASAATGVNGDQNDQSAPGAGAVYMLTRAAVWSQQSYVKASNTGEGDQFSSSLALSGDGNTLAVGAHFEDSDATGIDGNQNSETTTQAGAVYVY
jgi:trimeric autotransporter adhesin